MRIILFLLLSIMSISISAQSWRYNNRGRVLTDRERVRITEENNNRVNRQNYDNYIRQERANIDRQYNNQRTYSTNSEQQTKNPSNSVSKESSEKVVSLVTNGTGHTKEEAVQNALRSAIEQTYGTFVSANTEVLNDDLIKDDIVTVSSGNIKSYKELSVDQSDEHYVVSVQTTISIDQLTKYAQSKGMQAELAGASFVMNMRMKELNKKNEAASIEHMIEKAKAIAKNGLFDYLLEIGEPRRNNNSKYSISIKILFIENNNTIAFYKTIYDTFKALSLTNREIEEYQKANIPYYVYNGQLKLVKRGIYALRNKYEHKNKFNESTWLMPMLLEGLSNYVIKDNMGNKWNGNHKNIKDANWTGVDDFSFNPAKNTSVIWGNGIVEHDNKRIYYVQEFSIEYTEEELSKLTSITIENKTD